MARLVRCTGATLAFAFASTALANQPLPWRNDWLAQEPATLSRAVAFGAGIAPSDLPLVIAPDGDILMRAPAVLSGEQFVRFKPDGAVRWRTSLGTAAPAYDAAAQAMLASASGSTYVAVQQGSAVAKLDASGSVAWLESIDTRYIAETGNSVLVLGCSKLRSLDAASGTLSWEFVFDTAAGGCSGSGLAVDAAGAVYLSSGTRLLKLDAGGRPLWTVTAGGTAELVGIGAGVVYAQVGESTLTLRAVRASDGAPLWGSTATLLGLVGNPAEPLVYTPQGVQLLASTDGTPRWTQPALTNPNARISRCAADNTAIVGTTQIAVATGTVNWHATLPGIDAYGNGLVYFANGCLTDGSTVFAAVPFTGAPPHLQRVDSTSGALLATIPVQPGPQALLGENIVADPQTVASAAFEQAASGVGLRVRAVNTADGSTRWEKAEAADPLPADLYGGIAAAVPAKDAVAVSVFPSAASAAAQGSNGIWVAAYALADGTRRWSRYLFDTDYANGKYQGRAMSDWPLADADGNVFVTYATVINDTRFFPAQQHSQFTVVKLGAADGTILWRHDDYFPTLIDSALWPQPIQLLGADILVHGPFTAPNASASLLKLSGQDGSVLWSSSVFMDPTYGNEVGQNLYRTDDGNVVVFGPQAWAKLDAQTGATLWSNTNDFVCTTRCADGGGDAVLPGGDILVAGQNASRAQLSVYPGHPGATPLRWGFDQNLPNLQRSFATTIYRDADGYVWARIHRYYRYSEEIVSLAKLDLATQQMLSQQTLSTYDRDPLVPWQSVYALAAPVNDRMLASTFTDLSPDPLTMGTALVDTGITATGNLALELTLDTAHVAPGQLVHFHLAVTYSGDAPVSGAKLIADFPWSGRAAALSCLGQSATCSMDSRADTLFARLDLQPGGRIDVTGQFRVSDAATPAAISAVVAGPTALNELDVSDNNVTGMLTQSLFFDGFE